MMLRLFFSSILVLSNFASAETWIKDSSSGCEIMLESDSKATWDGSCINGKANDNGTIAYINNSHYKSYSGALKSGKKHGSGALVFTTGDSYVGEFKDGEFLSGKLIFSTGENLIHFDRDRYNLALDIAVALKNNFPLKTKEIYDKLLLKEERDDLEYTIIDIMAKSTESTKTDELDELAIRISILNPSVDLNISGNEEAEANDLMSVIKVGDAIKRGLEGE